MIVQFSFLTHAVIFIQMVPLGGNFVAGLENVDGNISRKSWFDRVLREGQ